MSLNIYAGWTGYALILVAFASLAAFLVAAATGFMGWAIIAGAVCVVAITCAAAVVGGAVRHDHRRHHETPHVFEAPCVRYYTTHESEAARVSADNHWYRPA